MTLFDCPEPEPVARPTCYLKGCDRPKQRGRSRPYCIEHECTIDECKQRAYNGRCKVHAYCKTEGCTNMRRQVQAGKYCDDHWTSKDYETRGTIPKLAVVGPCVLCHAQVTRSRNLSEGRRPILLCDEHRKLHTWVKRLRNTYNLDDEQIHDLAHDATCWVCRLSLAWRLHGYGNLGRSEHVEVDHDHACRNGCTGERSCGECVRGLTDGDCNRQLGHLERFVRKIGPVRIVEIVASWMTPDQLTQAADVLARSLPPKKTTNMHDDDPPFSRYA